MKITDILTKVDPTTVGRLAYLSTYLTFNHQLLYKGRGIPIRKEDLSKILNVTRLVGIAANDVPFSINHGDNLYSISKVLMFFCA